MNLRRSLVLCCGTTLTLIAHATAPEEFNYMLHCQGCHLPDGRGFPSRNVPDLRDQMGKFLRTERGREFVVRVPGSAQSDLDDLELAKLLNWMLIRFSPDQIPEGNKPYTELEVSRLRQDPLINVRDTRQELIREIEDYEKNR